MKTTIYIGTSLDGFIARTDGSLEWLVKFESEQVNQSYKNFIGAIDAIVIGRKTYETVLSFPSWPYEQRVFMLSSTLKEIPDTLKGKVTIVSMQPRELLDYLSGLGFSNVYVDGGKVIQSFLREDCIDEMIITRVPVLIGSGVSLFGYLNNDLSFKHIQTNVYTPGLVTSYYRRERK